MRSIIIVGLSGVGKTSAGEYLESVTDALHVEASKYMRQMWSEAGSQGTLQSFAISSLERDPSLVSKRILQECKQLKIQKLVVTGLRSPVEVKTIQQASQSTSVLLLSADVAYRLRRLRKRARHGDPLDADQLRILDDIQLEMGMELLTQDFDEVIFNNGSRRKFCMDLRKTTLQFFANGEVDRRVSLDRQLGPAVRRAKDDSLTV